VLTSKDIKKYLDRYDNYNDTTFNNRFILYPESSKRNNKKFIVNYLINEYNIKDN
jgi:hypothetical protein